MFTWWWRNPFERQSIQSTRACSHFSLLLDWQCENKQKREKEKHSRSLALTPSQNITASHTLQLLWTTSQSFPFCSQRFNQIELSALAWPYVQFFFTPGHGSTLSVVLGVAHFNTHTQRQQRSVSPVTQLSCDPTVVVVRSLLPVFFFFDAWLNWTNGDGFIANKTQRATSSDSRIVKQGD